ncbi:MAG TPA: FtsX-like permease family protein, partial [Blastocatellia bacterium]
ILTSLSVSISIFIFCALITIVRAVDSLIHRYDSSELVGVLDRYGTSSTGFPQAYVAKVKQISGVTDAFGINLGVGMYRDDKESMGLWASDHEAVRNVLKADPGFVDVSETNFGAFEQERTAALVGKSWMKKYGWKTGDEIIIKGAFPTSGSRPLDISLKVVGEMTGAWDRRIILHRDYLQEMFLSKGMVDGIMMAASRLDLVQQIALDVDAAFMNSAYPVKSITSSEFFSRFMAGVNLKTVIVVISLVVFIATTSITANSIALSVRERKREVAIMKTLGFRTPHILGLLLGEAVMMTMIGGLIGALTAYLLFRSAGFLVRVGPLSYFEVPFIIVAYGVLSSIVIGLLSGLVPSVNAYRVSIINALREVS